MTSKNKSIAVGKKIAIYPGSFDPITLGHVDIIQRISKLYDEVIVLVSNSADKQSLFSVNERMDLIKNSLLNIQNIKIDSYKGLTVDYAKSVGAKILIRGLRAVVDFEYEVSMGNINRKIAPEIETVLVFASPEYYFISSRMVKDVAKNKGPLNGLVPEVVINPLQQKWSVK